MADLVNLMGHMAGKAVLVNGQLYQIDDAGIAKGVADEDAAKLLQGKAWMVYDPEAAAQREERRKALREQYKAKRGGVQLLTSDGKMLDHHAINKAQEKAALPPPPEDFPSMKSEPSDPTVDAGVPVEEPIPPEVQAAVHEEKEALGPEDEWPDPEVSMKKSFLQDMAHAYGIAFSPANTKPELVSMITKAMYDET